MAKTKANEKYKKKTFLKFIVISMLVFSPTSSMKDVIYTLIQVNSQTQNHYLRITHITALCGTRSLRRGGCSEATASNSWPTMQ